MRNYKAIAAVMTAMFMMSAASCGKDETEDQPVLDLPKVTTTAAEESSTQPSTETTAVTTSAEEKSTEPATTDAPHDEPQNPDEQPDEPDQPQQPQHDPEPDVPSGNNAYVTFDYSALNSDPANFTSVLGTPNDVMTSPGCLANGADSKVYSYDGLTITSFVLNGGEYIYDITITGSGYSTSAGISVGSSRSDVENAYGAGQELGGYVVYENGNSELDFVYSGDTVQSITFYMAV